MIVIFESRYVNVCVCMCVCVCVCMCMYVYKYVRIYSRMCTFIYVGEKVCYQVNRQPTHEC